MELFYNQSWFWAMLFTAIAPLGGILIKGWITSRSQVRIERLKKYDSDVFSAYRELHRFISSAYSLLWPPTDPPQDFRDLMRHKYFKGINDNILFYTPNIRKILEKLKSQYVCMGNPDLIPEKPFKEFYKDHLYNLLCEMEKAAQQRTDMILNKIK